ncbi:MAG TPA: DUF4190 domain-containing protein [Streptosporangiaceae bacterium]|jgi:hypothetical protein
MADERSTPAPPSLLAWASLICGIIWVLGIGSVLAVVCGHLALYRVRRTGQRGRWMALVGLLLGYIGIVVTAVLLLGGGISVQGEPIG